MIIIVDDSFKKRKTELRELLYGLGIPCAVVDSEKLKKLTPAVITIAFAESEDQLSIVSLRAGVTDYLVINDTGRRMFNHDAYFYDEARDGAFGEFIKNRIREKHGCDVDEIIGYPIRGRKGKLYFFNRRVSLTPAEEMIVRHLLFSKGEWHTSEEIQRFAGDKNSFQSRSAVTVHICNINKKSVEASGKKIILTKRYSGYKINVPTVKRMKRGPYKRKVNPPRFV